jgi:hypothetical protein
MKELPVITGSAHDTYENTVLKRLEGDRYLVNDTDCLPLPFESCH